LNIEVKYIVELLRIFSFTAAFDILRFDTCLLRLREASAKQGRQAGRILLRKFLFHIPSLQPVA
jgi:hypothetical protein